MLSQTNAPTSQPVSIFDARLHCAITDDTHDILLAGLIRSATQWVEQYLGARIMPQGVKITLPAFPKSLPVYPIISVDSVKYDDVDGVEQTLAASEYNVSPTGLRPLISPATAWPAVSGSKPNPVRIEATVGFSTVPDPIKRAILVMVQEMYAHRGDSITGTMVSPSRFTVSALLSGYRRQVL